MIIKMKSVAVLGLESSTETILEELRGLGVVHVQHVKPPEGEPLEQIVDEIGKANTAINLLTEASDGASAPGKTTGGRELIAKIFALGEKKRSLEDEVIQLQREAQKVVYLGDFRSGDVEVLGEKDIEVRLFECDSKQAQEIPSDFACSVVGEREKKKVFAAFSYKEHPELPFEEVPIPPRSARDVETIIAERSGELESVKKELESNAPGLSAIQKTLVELENQRDFEKVRAGKGEEDKVLYIRGFCPEPELKQLEVAAEKNSWGLAVDDPEDDEEPPTLLKNPAWIRIIKPVFDFIQTVPGYREFDISMWFLLFFSVFFAMLIGDAGYGLIYLGATVFAQVKLGKKVKSKAPFILVYVLSICTVIWGALTGNWFGVEAISQVSPFKDMIIPSLNAYSSMSQNTVIHICFVIGAVQLTIGHLMAAFRYINSLKAIEQIGWIFVIWAAYFLACMFVLKQPIPSYFTYLLGTGVGLVLFTIFADRQKRKHAPIEIWDLFMSSIGAFADTMSYIRLFAVGLATLAVAQSFNSMAMTVGFNGVVSGFFASLILFLGHTLNIVLALMAVVVHGVRLNMLEFSGHVGNTWSGRDYSPFEKKAVDLD